MARLPTGRAPTTGLAGAQVHPRRLEAQGPKRRSRQSGRVVTAASLSPSPRNSEEGVAHKAHRLWDPSKNPACGLVDNASFLLFRESCPPTVWYVQKGTGPTVPHQHAAAARTDLSSDREYHWS